MGIKRLVIKDCLGIEELALNPGKVTLISGGNEKGKTSILESIEKALYNTKRRARFVRTGAEKAYIELETDDGISIKRTVAEDEAGLDKGSVKVVKDDVPMKAPETYLKALFGSNGGKGREVFSFNPVDFMQKKDSEQTDILLSLLPIRVTAENSLEWFKEAPKVNYEKHGLRVLKDLEQWFYEMRHEANTRVKATEDEVEAVQKRLPDNYELTQWEGVNLGGLFNDVRAAEESNRGISDASKIVAGHAKEVEAVNNKYDLKLQEVEGYRVFELKKAQDEIGVKKQELVLQIEAKDAEIEELRQRIQVLEHDKDILQTNIRNLDSMGIKEREDAIARIAAKELDHVAEKRKADLALLQTKKEQAEFYLETHLPIDIAPLKAKADEAERMKSFIPLAKEVMSLRNRLAEEVSKADHYDKCVTAARKKPHELLSTVELPVKGLGIDGRGLVTINGLPLSNLSTAQQVRSCLEIARALAKDTLLKIVCIDKIEHLDETVRAEFMKQIEEDEGFQYFVTQVTDGELKVEAR